MASKRAYWQGSLYLFCALFALRGGALAAPVITGGPVNAASYAANGLPNSGIAQGAMFVLFGTDLGPFPLRVVTAFPLPTELAGTSVRVTVGGTTVNAIMIYTVGIQVAAVLPSSTPLGDGSITVSFSGQTSNSVPIRVVRSSFGAFARNQAGSGPGIIQNVISETDRPFNTLIEAAQSGQVEILWGTGLGPVSGNEAAGPLPGNLDIAVEVFVGNTPATITYKGRSGCCVGIDQIVFVVPPGIEGCYVPVSLRVAGVMSNFTTMAINSQGKVCSDPIFFSATDLAKIQSGGTVNVASIALERFGAKLSLPGLGTLEVNFDNGEAQFSRYNASDILASPGIVLGGLPSFGACNVSTYRYTEFFDSLFPNVPGDVPHQGIDAGAALNVSGPRGTKQLPKRTSDPSCSTCVGEYEAQLGGFNPEGPPLPDYLDPGTYTIDNGSGGAAVGAFRTTLTVPSTVVWSNRDAITTVSRTQDLTVTWTGADSSQDFVVIIGSSANTSAGVGAGFFCTERAGAGTFTVPSRILSALPSSGPSDQGPVGFLTVGKLLLRQPSIFQAPGVDIGFQQYIFLQFKNVNYQ